MDIAILKLFCVYYDIEQMKKKHWCCWEPEFSLWEKGHANKKWEKEPCGVELELEEPVVNSWLKIVELNKVAISPPWPTKKYRRNNSHKITILQPS